MTIIKFQLTRFGVRRFYIAARQPAQVQPENQPTRAQSKISIKINQDNVNKARHWDPDSATESEAELRADKDTSFMADTLSKKKVPETQGRQ